jgi:flagellar basal body rod protein FlgB
MTDSSYMNLAKQRLSYLSHSVNSHTRNIAASDIPSKTTQELIPFKKMLDMKSKEPKLSFNKSLDGSSIKNTRNPIKREDEVMKISEVAHEYQGIMGIIKNQLNLMKATLPR